VTHDCDGVRLHAESLDSEGGPAAAPRRCALRVAGPLRRVTPTRVTAPLDCRGLVALCQASKVVIHARVRGRWRRLSYGEDTSSMTRTFRVSLLPSARRLISRRGSLRVRVRAVLGNGGYGEGEPRTGLFRLR
jgi:hypothetical protein